MAVVVMVEDGIWVAALAVAIGSSGRADGCDGVVATIRWWWRLLVKVAKVVTMAVGGGSGDERHWV